MLETYNRILSSLNIGNLVLLTVIALLFTAVGSFAEARRQKLSSLHGAAIRDNMLKSLSMGGIFISKNKQINKAPVDDIEKVFHFFDSGILNHLIDALLVPLFLFSVFLIHPSIGLLITLICAIYLFSDIGYSIILKRLSSRSKKTYPFLNTRQQMHSEQMKSIQPNMWAKAFWLNTYQKFEQFCNKAVAEIQSKSNKEFATNFVKNGGQILILAFGAYLVINGELSPALMIVVAILFGKILQPIAKLTKTAIVARTSLNAFRKLHFIEYSLCDTQTNNDVDNDIQLNNVVITNETSTRAVIKGVSLSVPKGALCVIIGDSGAGKTTLLEALVGNSQLSGGEVRIGGERVIADTKSKRRLFYHSAFSDLFPGTILENIGMLGTYSKSEIEEASKKLGLHRLIERLPSAYETSVSSDTVRSSKTITSLIIVCRIMCSNEPVLILDDPCISLPLHYKKRFWEYLSDKMKLGHTILMATSDTVLPVQTSAVLKLENGTFKKVDSIREKEVLL